MNIMKKIFILNAFSISLISFALESGTSSKEQLQKDLVDPKVDAVKITDHFKKVDFNYDTHVVVNGIFKGLVLEALPAKLVTDRVLRAVSIKEQDKLLKRFMKAGASVVAVGAGLYLVSDGITKFFLTVQGLEPAWTSVPGVATWAVREVSEFLEEIPQRVPTATQELKDSVKGNH